MPSVLRRWIVPQHSHRALCLPCCAVAAAWCQSFESEGWGPALASSLIAVFLFWLVHFRLAQRDWSVSFLHLASLKTAVSRCDAAYTFSSHTRVTPVAVVLFLNGLKPNLSYNRKLRSLFVLVKSTRRFGSALAIMASSRAEPQPLPCHCGCTASLPI